MSENTEVFFYLTNFICILRMPVFWEVADRELSINSARANAKEIDEKNPISAKKRHPIIVVSFKNQENTLPKHRQDQSPVRTIKIT